MVSQDQFLHDKFRWSVKIESHMTSLDEESPVGFSYVQLKWAVKFESHMTSLDEQSSLILTWPA